MSLPPNASVRKAVLDDADFVAAANISLAKETENIDLDAPTVAAGVRAVLDDSSKGTYWILTEDGKPSAQLMITYEWSDWRNCQVWWIQSVFVVEERRRQGLFKALYAAVREEAKKAGAGGLRLYADYGNERAHKTYENLGMKSHYKVYEEMFGAY